MEPYPFILVQKEVCIDDTDHLYTLIFKFKIPESKTIFIVRAEYYNENVFAIKFYRKADAENRFRYNTILNRFTVGTVLRIIITCIEIIKFLLGKYPESNFAVHASRSVDINSREKLTEDLAYNQRYRIYSKMLNDRIGNETFTHIAYPDVSSYLLINNSNISIAEKEKKIWEMFEKTYDIFPDFD